METGVRTRFAPSPTGHLHIGNARTAILNWLFTRHMDGRFLVRIEDTDQERSSAESEKRILDDLRWLGLEWDEGPGVEGPFGPYRQSERLALYARYIEQLVEKGRAYPCYCTPEELEARRTERLERGASTNYDGRCRNLTEDEKQQYEREGRRPVIRFRSDETRDVGFHDLIRGEVVFPGSNIGDFVIARQNGTPMYNFCCAADDHLMEITHVIRGDDHVSNTPRQVLIYEALGWNVPKFGHSPMILGPNRERLSKRHGATSVSQYREAGYLPQALVNFLSLLSWSSESGEEILSLDRLVNEFDIGRVSKSAAVFDVVKLNWMNGMYIRDCDPKELGGLLRPFLSSADAVDLSAEQMETIARLFQEKIETLAEIDDKAAFLFADSPEPETDEAAGVLSEPDAQQVIGALLALSRKMDTWNAEQFPGLMKQVQKETGVKGKMLWMPVRVALTGMMHGPDLAATFAFLGRDRCLGRLEKALQ